MVEEFIVDNRAGKTRVGILVGLATGLTLVPYAISISAALQAPDALVQQLAGLPSVLYGGPFSVLCDDSQPCHPPPVPAWEAKRNSIELQLRAIGEASVPALARGLKNKDATVRSNSALMLSVLGSTWSNSSGRTAKLNIDAAVPALIVAVGDSDLRVKAGAAQTIGDIGPDAAPAVPALLKLLSSWNESSRISACIGLAGIGPPAKSALPTLKWALFDPRSDVRRFAAVAIGKIEVHPAG